MDKTFSPANILIPSGERCDLTAWSVVACDQYTSEPKYWEKAEKTVGDRPSSLRITFPEIYLGREGKEQRINAINSTMESYLAQGIFEEYPDSFIYTERTLAGGGVRKGLIGRIDLEAYDYSKGSQSPVRATEGTVLERIPPRVAIRKDAALEIPHIMLLIDDPKRTVIEPVARKKNELEKIYDFDLMLDGGHIEGYLASSEAGNIGEALTALADKESFEKRYNVSDKGVLLFAVGDGNHSLATAKECFERIKATLPREQWEKHPARYALVEVVNLHDSSLGFEPIHRVVFEVNTNHLLQELTRYYDVSFDETDGQSFSYITATGEGSMKINNPSSNLTVGSLQNFLDWYVGRFGGRIDYIHGDEVVRALSANLGTIGFLLPNISKAELFPTVILDGALPRKTFSMGHANDKRFYLEARKIK